MKNFRPWNFIRNLGGDVFDTLFPTFCPICGNRLLRAEQYICATCLLHLPFTNYHGLPENPIELLLADMGERFIRANSFIFYIRGSKPTEVFFEFKYRNHPQIAVYMGQLMAKDVNKSNFFNEIDAIVPIPLSPKRLHERGYNQSYMLAKGIAKETHLPILTHAVIRKHFHQSQTRLNKEERYENVKDAFRVARPELLRDKHILLVDDVLTFGFTLRSCIREILKIENTRVSIMTLGTAYKKMRWKPVE